MLKKVVGEHFLKASKKKIPFPEPFCNLNFQLISIRGDQSEASNENIEAN